MESRKGQLAVETMIIYGLVILVALTVIGGLLYFNILDIGSYLPDKCDVGGTGDLKCEEMQFSSGTGTFQLGIRNIGQKPLQQLNVSVSDQTGIFFTGSHTGIGVIPANGQPISSTNALGPGEIALINITVGNNAKAGKVLRGNLVTDYKYEDGAVTLEASGSVRVRAT